MDKQRQPFTNLVKTRFAALQSDTPETSELLDVYIDFSLTHEKLRSFGDSVFDILVCPRLKIIAQELDSANIHRVTNDAILAIESTNRLPGTAKFRVSYEVDVAAQSLLFKSDYRITSNVASYTSDGWHRTEIKKFRQTSYCSWIENELLGFAASYHKRLLE